MNCSLSIWQWTTRAMNEKMTAFSNHIIYVDESGDHGVVLETELAGD